MFRQSIKTIITPLALLAFLSSCGSGTSNDQGVSFTALQYVAAPIDDACSTQGAPLTTLTSSSGIVSGESNSNAGGAITATAVVQNNLTGQFIRIDRVELEYFIAGAQKEPPSTLLALNGLVAPFPEPTTGDASGSGLDSSLPTSFTDGSFCNRAYVAVNVLPSSILDWINFNSGALPEPPFTVVVRSVVSGVTSAGNRFNTNPLDLAVTLGVVNVIEPPVSTTTTDTEAAIGGEGVTESFTDL